MPDFRRLIRGTIKNALVWGIGWTVLGFAATMLRKLTGNVDTPMTAFDVMIVALKIGLGGGIAGAAFSAYIAYAYRRRDIRGISWLKFGIGGAVATAVSITAFVQSASVLGGGGLVPLRYLLPTTAMFAAFGFCVAAVSIKVAQSTKSQPPDSDDALFKSEARPSLPFARADDTTPSTIRERSF